MTLSIRTYCLTGIFAALLFLPAHAEATGLPKDIRNAMVPHKALYDIRMVARKNSSQVLNISGQMFFEWNRMCEAWTTDHRFNLEYEYADTAPINITSDFSTYETFDGTELNFNSSRKRNGHIYQEIRGMGEMPESGGKGEALYSMPDGLEYDLEPGTLFPMAHTLQLLDHAEDGKKFYNATVFDGSDEDGPVEINSFIGAPMNAMAGVDPNAKIDVTLINTPSWNVRMAFFPTINPEAESDYEMTATFHNNGVISDMLVEYSDFSVTQKLVALEKLVPEDCE